MEGEEIWIVLTDPAESRRVDGCWGAAIDRLSLDDPLRPWILTEPRVARCVARVAPGARVRTEPPWSPVDSLRRHGVSSHALLELLVLHGRVPDPNQWSRVRSFGLRAALLGTVLAETHRRSHVALIGDSATGAPTAVGQSLRLRRFRRLLGWVIDRAERIETPDPIAARRLETLYLAPAGKIVPSSPARPDPRPRNAEREGIEIAFLASTRSERDNAAGIDALAQLTLRERLRVHWLARRQGPLPMRARQRLRARNLAGRLRWEEEPWIRPLSHRPAIWHCLLVPDHDACGLPLVQRYLSMGGTAIVADRSRGGEGVIQVRWRTHDLREALHEIAAGFQAESPRSSQEP